MGNTLSAMVGWVIVFSLNTVEKFKEYLVTPKKQKDYMSHHEIILKDEENQVGKFEI